MKLLYTNFHEGDGGGHTTYVVALARALAARHEVHVAAPRRSRLLAEARMLPGVHAVAQGFPNGLMRLPLRLWARHKLKALLREHEFDVVHVNGSSDHRLVLSALRGLKKRPKVVLTKHNSKPMTGLGHWWRARRTDQVIAVCDHTLRQLQETAYRRCRLRTVHNGIDVELYAPWPAELAATQRRQWIGEPAALVLGSNAGTAAYKGWMDLVEAIALLSPELRGQVQVLIAGKPPAVDARRRVAALGLKHQVHFTGLLADTRPMIAAIDVGFVLSYDVETISFACREMMAMGKPVLLTDYAGLPENIEVNSDGWLVPVRDPHAIADRLRQILDDRAALANMAWSARERALAEFGLQRFVERTETVYLRLLHS